MDQINTLHMRLSAIFDSKPGAIADPFATWNELREHSPVYALGDAVLVPRHADIKEILMDQRFLSNTKGKGSQFEAVRARLGGMAGNAALGGNEFATALADLDTALADAGQAGDKPLAGSIGADRARALVALSRTDEAVAALQQARTDAPQDANVWLLSATLSRRTGDLRSAQARIETAAGLAPSDPAIGLEAGVIAELAGNDDAARKSWNAVVALAPDGPEAASAKAYLAQIGGGQ